MIILVTGGAGFIGSNFAIDGLTLSDEPVVNLDKRIYAGNLENLARLHGDERQIFVQGDLCDLELVESLLTQHRPRAVIHFAAESHVDDSTYDPENFIQTNIVGTFRLLEAVRAYWSALPVPEIATFRFLHVSTDEVYGTLAKTEPPFAETFETGIRKAMQWHLDNPDWLQREQRGSYRDWVSQYYGEEVVA